MKISSEAVLQISVLRNIILKQTCAEMNSPYGDVIGVSNDVRRYMLFLKSGAAG
jgi:hypothetical protein